jgi:NADPH2 dehydrogenase
MNTFKSYNLKNTVLKNRIVMPPMCMYSSDETGKAGEFHFNHYVSRAVGGVGMIIAEATAVQKNGRTTDRDLGLWEDNQIDGLNKIVEGIRRYGTKAAIQLNHGGRKYTGSWGKAVAPSSVKFSDNSCLPEALTEDGIKEIADSFKNAAVRADKAGFDVLELHAAHGYLIHQFLSPLSNIREDRYGGNLENRTRLLSEILLSVRSVWPEEKPILLRVSADDYKDGGITLEDMVQIINSVKGHIDMVHVSTGGLVPAEINAYPGYQVNYSNAIKHECNIPTIAVGLITGIELAEEIISDSRADLVAVGRELLRNPYFAINAARANSLKIDYPEQYKAAYC